MRTVHAPPRSPQNSGQLRRVVLEAVARREAAKRLSLAFALLMRADVASASGGEDGSMLAGGAPQTYLSSSIRSEEGLG
jgi:hypothetical protein